MQTKLRASSDLRDNQNLLSSYEERIRSRRLSENLYIKYEKCIYKIYICILYTNLMTYEIKKWKFQCLSNKMSSHEGELQKTHEEMQKTYDLGTCSHLSKNAILVKGLNKEMQQIFAGDISLNFLNIWICAILMKREENPNPASLL